MLYKKPLDCNKITLVVFLDLTAAFDKASPRAVSSKLAGMGVEGNIFRWLHNYLSNRKFSVRIKNQSSDQCPLYSSVPQGSVLSPTLFNILLSDLPQWRDVKTLVYADDITLYVTATDISEARSAMQQMFSRFEVWSSKWGMQKSTTSLFTQKRAPGAGPQLTIGNNIIPCCQINKLFGVTWDSPNLTWNPHVQNLIFKCHKRLDIMRCMAGTNGISRGHLRTFYTAYIKSVLDYCQPVYSSAAPTTLRKLDVIHNTALRIMTGVWKSTPIEALYCEAGVIPPSSQRASSSAIQCAKLLSSLPDHPIHELYRRDHFLTYLKLGGKQFKTPLIYTIQSASPVPGYGTVSPSLAAVINQALSCTPMVDAVWCGPQNSPGPKADQIIFAGINPLQCSDQRELSWKRGNLHWWLFNQGECDFGWCWHVYTAPRSQISLENS